MSGKSRDPGIEKMVRWAMRSVARHVRPVRLPTIVLMTDDTLDVDWAEVTGSLPCPVTVIARHRDGTELEKLARNLRLVCRKIGHKLLLSSDPKLAQRLRADGVHLPQALMQRIHDARRRNPNWIVTVSAHDHASVTQASRLGADAIILSPAFATQSHPGRGGRGVVRLATMASDATRPVIALGGIDGKSVQRLGGCPLAGLAAIRGLAGAYIRS